MKYKNIPKDLTLNYKVRTYTKIEELFDLKDGEMPSFHFMLALMGYKNDKKIELTTNDNKNEKSREFSLRTIYPRNESDMDTYYGLLAILDNLELPYEETIERIAFERTEINGTPFLKMKNVKTFYEYMLGGLIFFEENFLSDGNDPYRVLNNIHEFLENNDSDFEDLILELMEEETKI